MPIRNRLDTGIEYEDVRMEFGLVSEFEERETASRALIRWDEWLSMDPRERADYIAHRRISQLIDTHVQEASIADSERKSKRRRLSGA